MECVEVPVFSVQWSVSQVQCFGRRVWGSGLSVQRYFLFLSKHFGALLSLGNVDPIGAPQIACAI